MNYILNILSYGSSILASALTKVDSLCSSKNEREGKAEAIRNEDQDMRIIQPRPPHVRIPQVILMSFGRHSFVGLAAAIARAGGFDNTSSLPYIATNESRFDDSSDDDDDDDDSGRNGFYTKGGSSRNGFLIRMVGVGGYANVSQSSSARGFYSIGGDQFGPHTL